jgi:thiamine-phosphate pyrophosphorylase
MDKAVLRIVDANFNRAREALRCMEEYGRFVLDDAELSGRAKGLRHELCQAIAEMPDFELLMARDTPGDVGTGITTESETHRADFAAVVQAAAKRLTEALRCLEEYGKLASSRFAARMEAIRYECYDLEKQLLTRGNPAERFGKVRLYVLLTEALCKRPILETARLVLEGGADAIQLREKDKADGELLALAKEVRVLCHAHDALFFMNDRADLAVLAGADGVHLGQEDLPVAQARWIVGPKMILGKSTHSLEELKAALAEGADYIAVGAIFASPTKPQVACGGLELLRQAAAICDRPILAIGGISADNAGEVLAAGAWGAAVCQAVIGQEDPAGAAEKIKKQIEKI